MKMGKGKTEIEFSHGLNTDEKLRQQLGAEEFYSSARYLDKATAANFTPSPMF